MEAGAGYKMAHAAAYKINLIYAALSLCVCLCVLLVFLCVCVCVCFPIRVVAADTDWLAIRSGNEFLANNENKNKNKILPWQM